MRPFKAPEAVGRSWAALLLGFGLLPWRDGLRAVGEGGDVYLFLVGMMLLSETARRESLFDWVAAAAVVLTPAVFAVARKAKVDDALPLLFSCAFIANAASFVLPISSPANLVLYGDHVPPLGRWLASFALPSLASVGATYLVPRAVECSRLGDACECDVDQPALLAGGWTALAGIGLTAIVLLVVSALDMQLGLPTCLMGLPTTAVILALKRESPWKTAKGVSWLVLPLVGGLFVMVEAVSRTGLTATLGDALSHGAHRSVAATAAVAGGALAVVSNLMNNLPAGLIASTAIAQAHPPQKVVDALLIGVDLGPNLSITGSLATILWLTAIRRKGEEVGFWRFLKVGALVTPAALILAIGGRLLLP